MRTTDTANAVMLYVKCAKIELLTLLAKMHCVKAQHFPSTRKYSF